MHHKYTKASSQEKAGWRERVSVAISDERVKRRGHRLLSVTGKLGSSRLKGPVSFLLRCSGKPSRRAKNEMHCSTDIRTYGTQLLREASDAFFLET